MCSQETVTNLSMIVKISINLKSSDFIGQFTTSMVEVL